ncbi:AI-2E family transporter [Chelativorans composti]
MSRTVQDNSFMVMVVLVTIAFIWLLLPFYGALLWAAILALLFHPLQRWLVVHLNGRKNLAAALTLTVCLCIVVIPGTLILASLAQEATALYVRISRSQFDLVAAVERIRSSLPSYIVDLLGNFELDSLEQIQNKLTTYATQVAQFIASRAVSIGQGTAQLFVSLGVMLYVLFFLFRDGAAIARIIRRASPLNDFHTDYVLKKFATVVKATVKGNVIIAVLQGAIGGITFWFLGVEAALLWGVLMSVLSLLPAIGSFLVWGPVAIYLLLTGDYLRAAILFFVGVFVIGLIDNLLRPPLVGKDTRLPDYVVLVSTVGGISLLGINGFVIGPLIAALFFAVWSLFASRERVRDLEQVRTLEKMEELGDRSDQSDIAAGSIESKS